MFLRMVRGTLFRQWKKMLLIAFTIALGASLCTAMLSVVLDVKDKVTQELKAYGANITVVPKQASILNDLYEVEGQTVDEVYLQEDELGNIKTIFWAFNIVDFAPFIDTDVTLPDGTEVNVTGTWFNHYMALPTGETLTTGVQNLRTWWDLEEGRWLDEGKPEDEKGVMVGASLAKRENLHPGDTLHVTGRYGEEDLTVVGVYDAGDDADEKLFTSLGVVQKLSNTPGLITSIEVSAITTPDNELAVKAAKDPKSLSAAQYETW